MLKTKRLLLRPFREDDFAALREIEGDPEILLYRSRSVITEAMTRDFLQQVQIWEQTHPRTQYSFAVILQQEDRLIGQIGMTLIAPDYNQAYLWYSLNRRYWGQGYMTEAARALLRFGFIELGLARIVASTHPDNVASARVMERIGMRQGIPPHPDDGVDLSSRLLYGIDRTEWEEQNDSPVSR